MSTTFYYKSKKFFVICDKYTVKSPYIVLFLCLNLNFIKNPLLRKIVFGGYIMSEKQKNLWKITAFAVFELFILIILCSANAAAFGFGCSGERVAAIQKRLKQTGEYRGEINGVYDFETRRAVKKLFPESAGEMNCEISRRLGLADEYAFSSACEITARYVSLRMEAKPYCEICGVIGCASPSGLMRKDKYFLKNIQKISPASNIFDIIIKNRENRLTLS